MVTLQDIKKAVFRIKPFIHRIPLIHSNSMSKMTGADIYQGWVFSERKAFR
jgi:threonine dehydratase